jgi:ABC-type multidrug transport system fused ATPase/permease subunit
MALTSICGAIEFRDVSFSYNHEEAILDGLSFAVKPGQKAAIVGRSGAGKSTIINLLCRFYDPQKGSITLDGLDLRNIKLHSLRKSIGLVSQEIVLFNTTIMENIKYGNPRATDDDILEAVRRAHIHELIESLPEKYDTVTGDRGVKLSGGERQRLSIARTILKDPEILILDEATSSLDSKSERLIQQSIEPLMRNRTCVIIAHRLSTIVDADVIFVLEGRRLIESGRHDELLRRGGVYRMLWNEMVKEESSG